jgi:hypothetical protein
MLDDLLGHMVGEVAFGRLGRSRRAQLLCRLFFGLLGAALGMTGAFYFLRNPPDTTNAAMVASMIAVFLSLSAFSLFNIGMARPWRWPGLCFVASFVSMILSRLVFGR